MVPLWLYLGLYRLASRDALGCRKMTMRWDVPAGEKPQNCRVKSYRGKRLLAVTKTR